MCHDNKIRLIENISSLVELTDYAVDGRYSIIHDDINDSQKYIDLLNLVILNIKKEKQL